MVKTNEIKGGRPKGFSKGLSINFREERFHRFAF